MEFIRGYFNKRQDNSVHNETEEIPLEAELLDENGDVISKVSQPRDTHTSGTELARKTTADNTNNSKGEIVKAVINEMANNPQNAEAILEQVLFQAVDRIVEDKLAQRQSVVEKPKTAKLPDGMYEDTLAEMNVGESGYTVPWAMAVAQNGETALNGKTP